MKFEIPDSYNIRKFPVDSVFTEKTTLMGISGIAYYCVSTDGNDIFFVLKSKIIEAKIALDRIRYSEAVVIEHDGKWTVLKSRWGNTNIDIFPVGYVHPEVIKTTKAFLFEILVIDYDGYGLENAKVNLENCRYINPTILSSKEADIGEWHDEHPLNYISTPKSEVLKYFEDVE